ncbi:MAG TPA: S1/P1 nuclease, partial [Pyrinomonadaceae bacterium]|nr:S1/P1 nuclease [Pyrinomonadaceae bacterium]
IHQPLHTVTRFTTQRPEGDRGGTSFRLSPDARRRNLHSYWDGGGGAFAFISRPLNDNGRNRLTTLASGLQSSFPKSQMTAEVNQLDPMEWAKEGKKLGIEQVYPNITEGSIPTTTYEENARKICRRRVALAGYRLAAILKQAF